MKHRLLLIGLTCLAVSLVLLVTLARAESREFTLIWQHGGLNTNNEPTTLNYFVVGWGFKSGPPYDNLVGVPGGNTRSHLLPLSGLAPGDIVYFSVQACTDTNRCSAWSAEVAHAVIADAAIPNQTPGAPYAVMLVIQPASGPTP